jgi:hypothetical protein
VDVARTVDELSFNRTSDTWPERVVEERDALHAYLTMLAQLS